jgi:hypothetical protein
LFLGEAFMHPYKLKKGLRRFQANVNPDSIGFCF